MNYLDIIKDVSLKDKILYISGYDNSNLRKVPATNTKPMKVMMKLHADLYPNSPYQYAHLIPVYLDKKGNGTTKIFEVYTDVHHLFDNEQDCIDHYNKSVDKVLQQIDEFKAKTLKNKI